MPTSLSVQFSFLTTVIAMRIFAYNSVTVTIEMRQCMAFNVTEMRMQ